MAILKVGTNDTYQRIADAVAAARTGDVVEVAAGTYYNDFVTVNAAITLRGVGGMVQLIATGSPADGKAIITTNTDLVLEHFALSGAKVPDHNGAGIRYQGGNLVVRHSVFANNQNGILANADPDGTITVEDSEFSGNGDGSGYTHNLYVGVIGQLTVRDSYFHDAVVGHEIKSRALATTITGTRIMDNDGTASYSVDLPNGGIAVLRDNVIQKGANAPNQAIIHFGGEGAPQHPSQLTFTGNTVVNDRATVTGLFNQTDTAPVVAGNSLFGVTAASLGGQAADNTALAARPVLDGASVAVLPAPAPRPAAPSQPVPDGLRYTTFGRDGAVRANGTILQVGHDKAFTTLQQAVAASKDGDTIQVDAGTYTDDFATANHAVIIEGVGGMARFVAVQTPENGRGTIVARASLTVRNLEFTGNWCWDGNGAGIRQEAGHLTVVNSYFHDNDTSILATAGMGATLSVYDTEIARNGNADKGTHGLNVGGLGSFTLEDSYVWGASHTGHEVNSKAAFTRITGSRVINDDAANPSFAINLGYGGDAVIRDTVAVKGAASENGVLIHVGGEGPQYANTNVRVVDSTLVTRLANVWHPYSTFLVADPGTTGSAPSVSATNVTYVGGEGLSTYVAGGTNTGARYAPSAVLDKSAPWAAPATPAVAPLDAGPNTLTLQLTGVHQFADAQFVVRVDGQAVGGGLVTAAHGRDPLQGFTFRGNWGAGAHEVQVEGINMRYGTSLQAGQLFVHSITMDGTTVDASSLGREYGGEINMYLPRVTAVLPGQHYAPRDDAPPAPAVVAPVQSEAAVLLDSRPSQLAPGPVAASDTSGVRGAGANGVPSLSSTGSSSMGAAGDVFDLAAPGALAGSGPVVLADTAAPFVPPAWVPATPAQLLGQAVALAGATVPAPVPPTLAAPASLLPGMVTQPAAAPLATVPADFLAYFLPAG